MNNQQRKVTCNRREIKERECGAEERPGSAHEVEHLS